MLADMKKDKFFSKKVCSETSFQRDAENKKKKDKHSALTSLKLLNKKYSKSLDDLTKDTNYNLYTSESRVYSFIPPDKNKFRNDIVSSVRCNNYNKEARRCIINLLMLNAWRKQKIGYKTAEEKIQKLNNKVEGFEMQVYVLRQLLNAEKQRVETANENTVDLLKKIEEITKEKNLIAIENENVEKNFTKLFEYCSQIENALKNQENEIITSRLEAENWEKQLEKEREKLKKMEREEIFLKEKIQVTEKVLLLKSQQIEQLTQENKELQQKLDVQVPLWDETMAQVDLAKAKLRESETLKKELEKVLEEKEKEIGELKATIASLEKKIREEDERKELLEKSSELGIIQKKLLELSKSSYPWSGGIIKIAAFCAKIPVACICTVGSLLLPFPSYRL